jgi:hypothetical protein
MTGVSSAGMTGVGGSGMTGVGGAGMTWNHRPWVDRCRV